MEGSSSSGHHHHHHHPSHHSSKDPHQQHVLAGYCAVAGFHGAAAMPTTTSSMPSASFFAEQEETAGYLGELEEALMHHHHHHHQAGGSSKNTTTTHHLHQQTGAAAAHHHGHGHNNNTMTAMAIPMPFHAGTTATGAAAARPPPTLDIFPSWPIRPLAPPHHHTPKEGSNVTADSTDSESSSKNNIKHSPDHQKVLAVSMAMASQFHQIPQQQQNHQQQHHHHHQAEEREDGYTTVSWAFKMLLLPRSPIPTKDGNKLTHSDRTGKALDPNKTMRRLAQNREAARKSRLRKKAYIQQLESGKIRLAQLELDLNRARSQGLLLGGAPGGNCSADAVMFDSEYSRWLDDDSRRMIELRGGLHAHLPDSDLRAIVDDALTHYNELFRLKDTAARTDVFHLITGMWATPAERCFLWIGGFRPSDMLKTLVPQLDPLTEQQMAGICSLRQSLQQAEEALTQGLEQLHQSLADTVAGSGSLADDTNMGSFLGDMALALGKLSNLEGFVIQADNLRLQTLHQMHRILTVRQAARCFLAIGEYHNRLRALSSLWASRPREIMMADEGNCGELSIAAHPSESQYAAF